MNITVSYEISNGQIENIEEIISEVYQAVLGIGCRIVRGALEQLDTELMEQRDVKRFRSKGFQKTCLKTRLGVVEYRRRVYVDSAAVEQTHCVHLLDEALHMKKVGQISTDICQIAAASICENTYQATADLISETTGLSISKQGVWNLVQQLGQHQEAIVDRHAELAAAHQGVGQIESKILYEENDGAWLKLQGKSRIEHGESKEIKIGIAYDGAVWSGGKDGKSRRILDNKVAYATFDEAKEFRRKKEGLIASRYDVDAIEQRVLNGDGASWIMHKSQDNTIVVLDEFHRNKKITECVRNKEFAQLLRTLLNEKRIDDLLDCIDAQINSVTEEDELQGLKTLQHYYTENKEALLGYFDRGMEIPETREPGVVHHARLGSMESNVFTLIGNRMKDRRACWSINGANRLALLLCQRHTTGFEYLFAPLPEKPVAEPQWVDSLPLYNSSKIPHRDGHGYEYPIQFQTENVGRWFSNLIHSL